MKSYLIIDGYNLLYEMTGQQGIELTNQNLEEYRDKLIEEIANFARLAGSETVLVFDALNSNSELSEEKFSGITVVYTGSNETADTYIERYLYTRPRHALVYLVTSDAYIQEMAILTGAQRISSRQFINDIKEIKKEHHKFGVRDKNKKINIIGDHLEEEVLELFENLRFGNDEKNN